MSASESPVTVRHVGPTARAALRAEVASPNERWVLVVVAAFADAGRTDPSIRELADRTGFERLDVLVAVERLEVAGWLNVRWGNPAVNQRNTYALTSKARRA